MLNRDNGEVTMRVRDNSYAGRLKRAEAKIEELQDVVEKLVVLAGINPTEEWKPRKED